MGKKGEGRKTQRKESKENLKILEKLTRMRKVSSDKLLKRHERVRKIGRFNVCAQKLLNAKVIWAN